MTCSVVTSMRAPRPLARMTRLNAVVLPDPLGPITSPKFQFWAASQLVVAPSPAPVAPLARTNSLQHCCPRPLATKTKNKNKKQQTETINKTSKQKSKIKTKTTNNKTQAEKQNANNNNTNKNKDNKQNTKNKTQNDTQHIQKTNMKIIKNAKKN